MRGDEPGGLADFPRLMPFSPHTRGYKSVLSHRYLSTKQLPRSFMVYIHRKPGLAFPIDPC